MDIEVGLEDYPMVPKFKTKLTVDVKSTTIPFVPPTPEDSKDKEKEREP